MNSCSVWCLGEEGRGNGWWVGVGFCTRRSTELSAERSGVMFVRSMLMHSFRFGKSCGGMVVMCPHKLICSHNPPYPFLLLYLFVYPCET